MNTNSISIIIPTYNEEKYIANCLNSLLENDYPSHKLEIIVIDGNSTDKTIKIVADFHTKYPFIKLLHNPQKITPISLNIGIKAAQNELIMISGAHAGFAQNYLKICNETINKFNADGVGGMLYSRVKNENKKTLSIAKVLSSASGVGNSMFRIGVKEITEVDTLPFGLYKRQIFEQVGIYKSELVRNHDIELSKRMKKAGKKLLLTPETYGIYYTRESFNALFSNNFDNGKWNILTVFLTSNFKSLSLRHFVPLLYILGLLTSFILGLIFSPLLYLGTFVLLAYLSFILYFSCRIKDKKSSIWYLFVSHIVLHHSYALGELAGMLEIIKRSFKKNG